VVKKEDKPRLEFGGWRKKEVQTRLVPVPRRILSKEEKEFNLKKKILHSRYKLLKAGNLKWHMLSKEDKGLLIKYYGIDGGD